MYTSFHKIILMRPMTPVTAPRCHLVTGIRQMNDALWCCMVCSLVLCAPFALCAPSLSCLLCVWFTFLLFYLTGPFALFGIDLRAIHAITCVYIICYSVVIFLFYTLYLTICLNDWLNIWRKIRPKISLRSRVVRLSIVASRQSSVWV